MRVGIFGSRDFRDLDRVAAFVAKLARKYPGAIVVSGGARGVDEAAELAALDHCLEVISYRVVAGQNCDGQDGFTIEVVTRGEAAERFALEHSRRLDHLWFPSFRSAAFHRNFWIAQDGEQLVCWWDGVSSGTKNTIDNARSLGKEPHIFLEE